MSSAAATARYKYPGFISYSHRDRAVADRLHRAIERYRVPARLAGSAGSHGPVPKRLYPIFRDRDELSAGALGPQLREAIAQSRCFVLICSPAAAQSRWVNEEVAHFLKVGDPARLLCLIADGTPNAPDARDECFPPAIREAGLEPMAAELHRDADGDANARLKIIAGLLGVGFEELRRRDLAARNRRLIGIAGASLGVAAVTVVLALQAMQARDEAERSRQQGEELIGFMLGELRGKLEPLGKLDILDAVGDKAMAYFAGLDGGRDPGPRALAGRAKALRQIGEVRFAQGRPADAVETLAAALKVQRDLVAERPDDNEQLYELGQTEFWVGYAAWRAGDYDRAEANFTEYQRISTRLFERTPDNRDFQAEVAHAASNLGTLAFERNRYAEALGWFRQAVATALPLIDDEAVPVDTRQSLLNALSWEGATLNALGDYAEGLRQLGDHASRMRALMAANPDDRELQATFADNLSAYGFALLEAGHTAMALTIASEADAIASRLTAHDPANLDNRVIAVTGQLLAASAHVQDRSWSQADAGLAAVRKALLAILDREAVTSRTHRLLLLLWELSWQRSWQRDDLVTARSLAAEALRIAGHGDTADALQLRLSAETMALELARYVDRDAEAEARHRSAAVSALARLSAITRPPSPRMLQLQAQLDLMSGSNHIADGALPTHQGPWAYSALRFVERRCRGQPMTLAPAACRQYEAMRTTAAKPS